MNENFLKVNGKVPEGKLEDLRIKEVEKRVKREVFKKVLNKFNSLGEIEILRIELLDRCIRVKDFTWFTEFKAWLKKEADSK